MRILVALSSGWHGAFIDIELPARIASEVRRAMNDLSAQFPSLSHINVRPLAVNLDWQMAGKSNTSLYVNAILWSDEAHFIKYAKEWDGCLVGPTPYGIVVHECGHILDGQLLAKMGGKKYNKWLDKWLPDRVGIPSTHTSPYGQENGFEFMAETFSVHFLKRTTSCHPEFAASQHQIADEIWTEAAKLLR